MIARIMLLLIVSGFATISAHSTSQRRILLIRQYQAGEHLAYRMKGINGKWKYQIRASGVVQRTPAGTLVEKYAWSNLVSNGATVRLPPSSTRFRQTLSLDPRVPPWMPNLSVVSPMLIGPITDLATFYADLWLAMHLSAKLTHAGDHTYVKFGRPESWADGKHVILGEDSVDFNITLLKIDPSTKAAALLVRHVPPAQPQIQLPAIWMRKPVALAPNNWVQVTKKGNEFMAAVGKETFDVQMVVSLADGRILSGSLENLVRAQERDCRDTDLTDCHGARSIEISRRIEISRMR